MSKPNTRAIIDANIRQNDQQLITGQVLNATLNAMVTDYAEQAALDGLKKKVDALALGAFYGYFSDSESLPTDVTTPGYAYVGLDNPYEIWNFNGESWSDSGTSIDMNDADEEDITRNADGKLQFKDRASGDGMGYVILRKDKTFVEQVAQANTIYEIRYDFDLNKVSVIIPTNCVLYFNGGIIRNGDIKGSATRILADEVQIFAEVTLSGTWDVANGFIEWFGGKSDGLSDSSSALMSAVKYFPFVQLLSGSYLLDKKVAISNACNIRGQGYQNTTIIACQGIDIITNNNCNIEGITFTCSGDTQIDYLISITGAFHAHFSACTFWGKNYNCTNGLRYYGESNTYYHVISKNRFVELEVGILFSYSVNGSSVIDNEFYQCKKCIINDSCNGNRFIGNSFQNYITTAIELQYNNYGSESWGNLILGNYFEGTYETAYADIDLTSNAKCRNNYIIGNKSTYITASYGNGHVHVRNSVTNNIILESTSATYLYPNKLTGFVTNEIIPQDYFGAFTTKELIGCIAPKKLADGSVEYWACHGKADGSPEWRKIPTTNRWGDSITIQVIQAQEIVQYDGGYYKIGRNAALGADRLTLDGSYDLLKLSDKTGTKWKYQQEVMSGTSANRPSYLPVVGFCYFDTTLNKPLWWTGEKWVDSSGADA